MRGEDPTRLSIVMVIWETPPRAWGRQREAGKKLLLTGNTPTCVGKTFIGQRLDERKQKHPHVRGEDNSAPPFKLFDTETPPRAWGRLEDGLEAIQKIGNTPTCVGKTQIGGGGQFFFGKHPHVRGEDWNLSNRWENRIETPPRAWGRLE